MSCERGVKTIIGMQPRKTKKLFFLYIILLKI